SIILTLNSASFESVYFICFFFFLMIRPTPRSTLFPYTTLFRSDLRAKRHIVTEDAKRRLTLHDATPQSVFGLIPDNEHCIPTLRDRKSTRLNSSHSQISYAVFCLKKKIKNKMRPHKLSLFKMFE